MKIISMSSICKRKENQDNYWSAILNVNGEEVGVLCVCDGMGGLDSGEKASRMLVSQIRDHFLETGTIEGIEDVVSKVNQDIKHISVKKSGTTCTVLMCTGGNYYIYNVGDSRCYKWSESGVLQITEDHTVIQKYIKEGKPITPEVEMKYKNILTRCVGVMPKVKYDIFTGSYSEGDSFLVCSDGFWHTISEEDFMTGKINVISEMITQCMDKGEVDNITACILKI